MTNREQPDPGEGWRLASGDDCKDARCEVWVQSGKEWIDRCNVGLEFNYGLHYRIPIDAPPATHHGGEPDLVNAPPHYRHGEIECIDAIRAALTEEEFRGYVKGNALKYCWRERHKGGDEDLRKAAWYLSRIETKEATQ